MDLAIMQVFVALHPAPVFDFPAWLSKDVFWTSANPAIAGIDFHKEMLSLLKVPAFYFEDPLIGTVTSTYATSLAYQDKMFKKQIKDAQLSILKGLW